MYKYELDNIFEACGGKKSDLGIQRIYNLHLPLIIFKRQWVMRLTRLTVTNTNSVSWAERGGGREWERDRKRERFKAAGYTAYVTCSASPIGRKLTQLRTETVVSGGIKNADIKRLRKGTRLILNSELRISRAVPGESNCNNPATKKRKEKKSPQPWLYTKCCPSEHPFREMPLINFKMISDSQSSSHLW